MAGRWTDDRDREAWERDPYGRETRQNYRAPERARGDDYGSSAYGDTDRSFDPRQTARPPLGPVFGERESGADYKPGGRSAGDYSPNERSGYQAYRGDDRYRDATPRPRGSSGGMARGAEAYREAYGYTPDEANRWEREYHEPGRGADYDREEPRRLARERPTEHRLDRDVDDRRGEGRGFLDRATQQVTSWFRGLEPHDDLDRGRDRDGRFAEHRGRGPAGYKRPDERIADEVNDRLTDDAWLDASNISVSVSGGEVTLSGTVNEREAKHRAERLIEDLPGVTHVQNNLRVQRGNFLTRPERGFGDSVQTAQMSSVDEDAARSSRDPARKSDS